MASRFGAAGETVHRLARGLGSRPLAVRPPAEDLSVAQEFDPPEPLAEPVVFAAKALAERMHQGLADRGLTCVRVQVRAACADGRESRRLWRHDGLLSAAALADRVRWQLDGWRVPAGQAGRRRRAHRPGDAAADGGIAVLRLVPDQVVHATGHQLALWGETVVSDRVARAAMRVQAMLGHEAVLRPALGGGRDVSEQVNDVPFGEKREPRLAAGPPWPGRIMGAAPGVVYPFAREADVTDDAGDAVTVTGRCVLSAAPAWLAADGEPPLRITGWAGPWPLSERWWDPAAARRRARFQLLTGDGRAWLAAVQGSRWLIEAGYWLWAGTTRRCPGASSGGGWPGAPRASRRTGRAAAQRARASPGTACPAGWCRPPEAGAVPWAELHCHSSYSFLDGAATPGELVTEAARLGLETLAITDHDGMYGVPQFAQAAARLRGQGTRLGTVFGAELSLDLPSAARQAARPGGRSPAGPGPRRRGVRPAVRGDQRRPAGGRGEGAPGLRHRRAGRRARRPLGGADRVPQGAGARGAGRGRAGRGLAGAGPADRDVRP